MVHKVSRGVSQVAHVTSRILRTPQTLRWVGALAMVASVTVAPAYAADPEAVAWRIADLLMGPLGVAIVLATGCVAIYRFLFGDHNGTGLLVTWGVGAMLFFGLNTIVGYLR